MTGSSAAIAQPSDPKVTLPTEQLAAKTDIELPAALRTNAARSTSNSHHASRVNCLILVAPALICVIGAFDVHAGRRVEARLSSGMSEARRVRQGSCENYFRRDRRPEYRVRRRGILSDGLLSSPPQNTAYLRIRETYVNYDYGYSVVIPKPLIWLRSPPPFPNHGFVIKLPGDPLARITVDANYNAAEWNSLQEALNANLEQFKRDSSGEVKIVMQRPAVLGGLKAVHFSLRSAAKGSKELLIRDVLLAFRKEPGGVGIVYEIALTTPAVRYRKDRRSAARLEKSFRLKTLPK